jgi:energy-coupling factor transport system ATP-binding protein
MLDEPTSSLDYAHMMETASLLKQLQSMGTTILVVTQDSELIHACCTRQYNADAAGNRSQ